MFCCSELFRRAAERAFPAGVGAGAAIRLPVVRRDVPLGRPGDVDVTTTSDGDVGIGLGLGIGLDDVVVVLVGSNGCANGGGRSGFDGVNSVPDESADASAA